MVNTTQFISTAVHKEIILSVITLPLRFVHHLLYFVYQITVKQMQI